MPVETKSKIPVDIALITQANGSNTDYLCENGMLATWQVIPPRIDNIRINNSDVNTDNNNKSNSIQVTCQHTLNFKSPLHTWTTTPSPHTHMWVHAPSKSTTRLQVCEGAGVVLEPPVVSCFTTVEMQTIWLRA